MCGRFTHVGRGAERRRCCHPIDRRGSAADGDVEHLYFWVESAEEASSKALDARGAMWWRRSTSWSASGLVLCDVRLESTGQLERCEIRTASERGPACSACVAACAAGDYACGLEGHGGRAGGFERAAIAKRDRVAVRGHHREVAAVDRAEGEVSTSRALQWMGPSRVARPTAKSETLTTAGSEVGVRLSWPTYAPLIVVVWAAFAPEASAAGTNSARRASRNAPSGSGSDSRRLLSCTPLGRSTLRRSWAGDTPGPGVDDPVQTRVDGLRALVRECFFHGEPEEPG
jgi:hypothetical protein